MPLPEVVVVAETPSLGSAVLELLIAEGLGATKVDELAEAVRTYQESGGLPRLLVCASSNRRCQTAWQWATGPFAAVALVVVGTRDSTLPEARRIHFVTLPLSPTVLVELVRTLVRRAPRDGPSPPRD